MNMHRALGLLASCAVTGIIVAACSAAPGPRAGVNPADIVCQKSASPAVQVFDHSESPIFAVGCYGGVSTFGDKNNLYAPGSVYNPAVQIYPGSPWQYHHVNPAWPGLKCTAGQTWYGSAAIYHCEGGRWRTVMRF